VFGAAHSDLPHRTYVEPCPNKMKQSNWLITMFDYLKNSLIQMSFLFCIISKLSYDTFVSQLQIPVPFQCAFNNSVQDNKHTQNINLKHVRATQCVYKLDRHVKSCTQ
jgi:hypothetical protein